MRRRALISALMLIGVGVFLGTTVFREDIARAAQIVSAEIVSPLDAQGNLKVAEQGTADVRITNRTVTVTGTVDVNVTTRKVLDEHVLVEPGGPSVIPIGTIETASLSQLRVVASLRDPAFGNCSGGVGLDVEGPAGQLLSVSLTAFQLNRVIDIPGPELSFSLVNNVGESGCLADVTVWGR
jgi:hypothetical protein